MSEVKRYDLDQYEGEWVTAARDELGDYVLASDYDQLKEENDRLRRVTHISIPTSTMEYEFSNYHRRGFNAGIRQGEEERDQLKADNEAYKKLHDWLKAENEVLTLRVMAGERQELDALKSAPVVMPDRRIQALAGVSLFDLGHAKGWNACLDEFARLNGGKP